MCHFDSLFLTRGQGHTTARPMQKILDDLKDAFDKKSEDLFAKLKSSFFTKGVIDAFEVINSILGENRATYPLTCNTLF